jgi:DNA end-binding protein Ku
MRAIWSGALSFGLINIPVRLFSGTEDHGISFTMLHKKDLSPIRFAKVCKSDGKEVAYEDIVKGYEYTKGEFVVMNEEDFEKVNLKKTKTIDIQEFTSETEIDTILYEKPYFLEPDKGADKAYVILREALKKSKKVGVAKFVFHNREHIAVIKPHGDLLILNQLRYVSEIRAPNELKIPSDDAASAKEVTMALKLIDHLSSHFKPETYHDTYIEELKDIIKAKSKGLKIKAKGKEPKITHVNDIMSLLKESLESHEKKKEPTPPTRHKKKVA